MSSQDDGPSSKPAVGLIGLGQMGAPMAANLLEDGHRVTVWNRTAEKMRPLVEKGARAADKPEDAAEPGAILITCLSNDAALEGLLDEHPGLMTRLGPEGVHVSTSTVAPQTARRMADRHARLGGVYVAAPIVGRPDAVAARKQTYLVAGPAGAVERAAPILGSIGQKVYRFGQQPPSANVAKLAVNFLIAAATEALAEAFTLCRKNDVDPAALHTLLVETLFRGRIYESYGRQILSADYQPPLFRLALGLKDMGLVNQLAFDSGTPMRLAGLLRDRYTAAAAHGRGDWDWTAIAAEVEAEAGLPR